MITPDSSSDSLIKYKNEVMQHFVDYQTWAENVTGNRLRCCVATTVENTYLMSSIACLLIKLGIARQTSPPYTPEHNGVAERANRTIVESARSMLHGANFALSDWGEAVMTASICQEQVSLQSSGEQDSI